MKPSIKKEETIILTLRETPTHGKFHKVQMLLQLVNPNLQSRPEYCIAIVSHISYIDGTPFDISLNNIKDRIERQILEKASKLFRVELEPWVRFNLNPDRLDVQKENEIIIKLLRNKKFFLRDSKKKTKPIVKILTAEPQGFYIYLTLDLGYHRPSFDRWLAYISLVHGLRSILQFINMEGATCRMIYRLIWKHKKSNKVNSLEMPCVGYVC